MHLQNLGNEINCSSAQQRAAPPAGITCSVHFPIDASATWNLYGAPRCVRCTAQQLQPQAALQVPRAELPARTFCTSCARSRVYTSSDLLMVFTFIVAAVGCSSAAAWQEVEALGMQRQDWRRQRRRTPGGCCCRGFAQLHGFDIGVGVFAKSREGRRAPAERACTRAGSLARADLAPPHASCLLADAARLQNATRRFWAGRSLDGGQGRLRLVQNTVDAHRNNWLGSSSGEVPPFLHEKDVPHGLAARPAGAISQLSRNHRDR